MTRCRQPKDWNLIVCGTRLFAGLRISVGRFCPDVMSPTVFRENSMPRTLNIAVPAALILSVLILSACATNPESVPVTETPVLEVAAEIPSAPAPVPAQEVVTEKPAFVAESAPRQVAPKAKKKVAKARPTPPKAAPPAPAPEAEPAPAPIVESVAPVITTPEPAPESIAPPAEEIAEAGFLEKYWIWLLALVAAITVIFVWMWKRK